MYPFEYEQEQGRTDCGRGDGLSTRAVCENEVDAVLQLSEGEESQVFSYACDRDEYVIRINPSVDGFQKDAYAYRHFHSERIPIPRVIQMGYIDEHRAFCLTENKYGDPLYDVATAYFWSPWLECMAVQAAYFETHLSRISRYHERIVCYQLRIGLAEVYETAIQQKWSSTEWAIRRCREIAHALG